MLITAQYGIQKEVTRLFKFIAVFCIAPQKGIASADSFSSLTTYGYLEIS